MMTLLLVMLGGPVLALAASVVTLTVLDARRSPAVQAVSAPRER
jgi:hypothetical protein